LPWPVSGWTAKGKSKDSFYYELLNREIAVSEANGEEAENRPSIMENLPFAENPGGDHFHCG
jgi:hypothetical protein